jgi:hypothetical protein
MKHPSHLITLIGLLALATSCGLFDGSSSGASDAADAHDTIGGDDTDASPERMDHLTMLASLGFDTDPDPATDPEGEPLAASYNPLTSKQTSLFKQCEIYTAAMSMDDESGRLGESLIDDEPADFHDLLDADEDADWFMQAPMAAAAADPDGDGFEEVVVAYVDLDAGALRLRVVEDASEDHAVETHTLIAVDSEDAWDYFHDYMAQNISPTAAQARYFGVDVAAGDLDGDGADELLVACMDTLYVVAGAAEDYAVMEDKRYKGADYLQFVRVDAGDLDEDGRDEFVVVDGQWAWLTGGWSAEYYLYDGSLSALIDSGQLSHEVDGKNRVLVAADPAIGDLDGDGLAEIAFAGLNHDDEMQLQLLILDDGKQSPPYAFLDTKGKDANPYYFPMTNLRLADLDGDRALEIIMAPDVFKLKQGELEKPWGNDPLPTPYYSLITTGDVTGDKREDVILIPWQEEWLVKPQHGEPYTGTPQEGIMTSDLLVYGLDSGGDLEEQAALDLRGTSWRTDTPVLVAANVDDDSAVVRFIERELLFTDPNILAVLSCPPYHSDIGQNDEATGTTFGQAKGQEVVEEESMGFSVGYSVGCEFEAPLGVASASFKLTMENSLSWSAIHSTSVETSVAYLSGPGEDKVVFTTIPFDVFYYEVLSTPDPEQVGSTITINIPRKPQILSVDREFYNTKNGDGADITPEVMGHDIGKVWSYPSKADKDELLAEGGLQSELATVGAGAGSVVLGISTTDGVGSGTSLDMSVGFEAEGSAGGFTAGTSASFDYGYAYELINTETTFYEGEVGDIATDAYSADLMYQFGLFVHEASHGEQRYIAVDYWVE